MGSWSNEPRLTLTAADSDHDFQLVGICQHDRIVLTARDNFAIQFNGDTFAGQVEMAKEFGNG